MRYPLSPDGGVMLFQSPAQETFARALSRLVYANPFLPERIELEQEALGSEFDPAGTLWQITDRPGSAPNVLRIGERAVALADELRERLRSVPRPAAGERALYEDLALYSLYHRYEGEFLRLILEPRAATRRVSVYARFRRDLVRLLGEGEAAREAPHLFAGFFQVRRAFHHIFAHILGASGPAVRLRAQVWQSIFTADMRRYQRGLWSRMGDLATLVQGPSGTGKELVVRAIGLSRYIPFDAAKEAFAEEPAGAFFALNLSALSPTLIESELFGHRRGAFTGALEDRRGWFEVCPPLGTVFLDEIGEVDPAIQVKLLRVLETRTFQRLGDTEDRRFQGKLIAATNRDLGAQIEAGRFREDFYYRLCSDMIQTPALAEQLQDSPGELGILLGAIARRVAGEAEAGALAEEAERWIRKRLGPDYPWPGNVRELEQCVRNILVRGAYEPRRPAARELSARDRLVRDVLAGALTAEELVVRYATLVYARTGSYQETARRLGLDRRTVRAKVDRRWLGELRGGAPDPDPSVPGSRDSDPSRSADD